MGSKLHVIKIWSFDPGAECFCQNLVATWSGPKLPMLIWITYLGLWLDQGNVDNINIIINIIWLIQFLFLGVFQFSSPSELITASEIVSLEDSGFYYWSMIILSIFITSLVFISTEILIIILFHCFYFGKYYNNFTKTT